MINIIIFLIFVIISISLKIYYNRENFQTSKSKNLTKFNIIVKQSDNTQIKLINHKWSNELKWRFKRHEIKEHNLMKDLLKELDNNSYIIDVGGHVGDTGLYLGLILDKNYKHKNIKVIIIEPDDTKIEFINKMCDVNNLDNIICVNKGVSNIKGKGKIIPSPITGYKNSGALRITESKQGNFSIDTLDNICKGKKISFMHIDVEGYEYKTLLGSKNILKKCKYLLIELDNVNKERSQEKQFLINNNYKDTKKGTKENFLYINTLL
jgi:FkbM family methyltransferase